MAESLQNLTSRVLKLDSAGQHREAIDLLFEAVNDALYAGHEAQWWPDIEELLADLKWSEASLTLLVGALTITLPVKNKIKNRDLIVSRVEQHPEAKGRVKSLLQGLV